MGPHFAANGIAERFAELESVGQPVNVADSIAVGSPAELFSVAVPFGKPHGHAKRGADARTDVLAQRTHMQRCRR